MIRVLFVSSSVHDKFNPFLNALNKVCQPQVVFFPKVTFKIWDRILFKVYLHKAITGYNRAIKDIGNNEFFDLTIVVKGSYVFPSTTKLLAERSNRLVYWSNDDIARRHNRTLLLSRSLKYYNRVYSMKILNLLLNQLQRFNVNDVEYLLQCYSSDLTVELSHNREIFSHEIVFIGSYEKERAKSILSLVEAGLKVDVFGNGWKTFKKNHEYTNLDFHSPVLGQDYASTILNAKIALCFLRKINFDSITVRSMEIPAYGGFCLGEYSVEHAYLFESGKEAVWFKSNKELVAKAKFYLKNDMSREQIVLNGNKKVRSLKSTYEEQVNYIIQS